MNLLFIIAAAAAVARNALAYQITNYFEETVIPIRTYTIAGSTSTRFDTVTRSVIVTDRVGPTAIAASTTAISGGRGRVTIVSALISAGIGSPAPRSAPPAGVTEYYVLVTYSRCFTVGTDNKVTSLTPLTKFASLSFLPLQVSGRLTPTLINTTLVVNPTTSYIVTQAVLDPTAVDSADVARASFNAQPTSSPACTRATTTIDYREVCTASLVLPAVPTNVACGELNPCCFGCQWWSDGFATGDRTEYFLCEDGTQRSVNGSILPLLPWGNNAHRGLEISPIAIGVAGVMGIVFAVML